MTNPRVLLTGATGYVGGRLLPLLEARGARVRCIARRPEALASRVGPASTVVQGDVHSPETLGPAMDGVDVAYYLVHSLGGSGDFEAAEEIGARNFAEAARTAGVRKIVFLGGLAHEGATDSAHMRSRHRVGEILRDSGVPTVEFRASVIIGSGSLSFELIRALVRRLPVMLTPRWVSVEAQPISITDVLAYLMAALDLDVRESRIYEIGGADRMSYKDLMKTYAGLRGLTRRFVPVPVLSPRLSSLWLHLVTPVYARVGRKLIDSITTPSVVTDTRALDDFAIRPMGARDAIVQALRNEDQEYVATRWADALSTLGRSQPWGGTAEASRIVDTRSVHVNVPPEVAFRPIQCIGGANGWYYGDSLWDLRGLMDRCVGGVGRNRGRRDPFALRVGDALDWWRVEQFDPPWSLVLAAEMKVPGRAWLRFDVEATEGGSIIRQTALFDPKGLAGLAYWYVLYPVHVKIFDGMIRKIAAMAQEGVK